MAEEKKDVPSLEDVLKSEAKDETTKTSPDDKQSRLDKMRRVDKAIVEQDERLRNAMLDENGNPRVAKNNTKRNPPSSHFPERIPLNEYNERLAAKRRASLKGKKSVSKEKAEENRNAVEAFQANYENQPFARTPDEWNELEVRSTPGADDAPTFSSAEKVAGSGTSKPVVIEAPAMQAKGK